MVPYGTHLCNILPRDAWMLGPSYPSCPRCMVYISREETSVPAAGWVVLLSVRITTVPKVKLKLELPKNGELLLSTDMNFPQICSTASASTFGSSRKANWSRQHSPLPEPSDSTWIAPRLIIEMNTTGSSHAYPVVLWRSNVLRTWWYWPWDTFLGSSLPPDTIPTLDLRRILP